MCSALWATAHVERSTKSAGEALRTLQGSAETLGEEPYTPPDFYPHTPDNEVTCWLNWAVAYTRFGLIEEALVRNNKALAWAPDSHNVLLNRGNLLSRLERMEEALAAYEAAEQVVPPDETSDRGVILNMHGVTLSKVGRYAEADEVYAQATRLYPDNALAWLNRATSARFWGIAEREAGEREAARAHFADGMQHIDRALALNPNNPANVAVHTQLQQELANT